MDYKKSMFILILGALVLLSMACACAGEANETTMAVVDADGLEISENNQVIGQSNDFTGVDESANFSSALNDVGVDETSQGGNAGEEILSSGEENSLKAGKVITVNGYSFGRINDAIKSASDGDTVRLLDSTYEGGKGDSITINKQITIEGNGAVLNIGEMDNIFKITAKNVVVDNICFKRGSSYEGGAICLTSKSSNCTISNCEFKDNHATRGSAIYDEGTNNKVLDCNIHGNRAEYGAVHFRGVNMTITGCTFTGNEATTGGGAVFLSGTGAIVVNCDFSENFAKSYAGAFQFNYRSVNCSVINSTFYDNYVRYEEAGAIAESGSGNVISHCDFKGNYVQEMVDSTGAAILSIGSYVEISYCTFTDHTAYYGAAIHLGDESSNSTVSNSVFTNNLANVGSAVYDKGSRNRVLNCDIYKNTAGNGAVCFNGVGGTVDSCVFTENEGVYGGAIYLNSSSSNCIISNSEFKNNTADENGGAIYSKNAVTIRNSTFDSNSASYGGAVFNNGKLEIVNCGFTNNLANRGADNMTTGNVLVTSSNCGGAILNNANLIVSCSTFENNNASLCGGAIANLATLNLENSIFKENGANLGGAIFNQFNMDVAGCNFTNNSAVFQGGAIFNHGGILTMIDSTFANNYATGNGGAVYSDGKFDGENTKFKNNRASNGGAIMNRGSSNIDECTFENNNVTGHGGAVFSEEATLNVSDSTFTGNVAIDGGAIHNHDGTFSISNSRLTNNTAVVGGAIVNVGLGKMLNVTVDNNKAINGAGIYNYQDDLAITDSTLSNNAATSQGGAIYSNATLVLKNSALESNSADYGGAVYLVQGDASLTNDVFERNTAKGGGAILNFNSALEISQSRFAENVASAGSAIWTGKADSLRITSRTTFLDNTDNMKSVRADEGSVDTSNCEFLYSISFEIGHIDDVVIDSPITINVAAKMKNNHLFNGNVIVNIGGESHSVKIINGSGKLTVTPNLGFGKYRATLNFNMSNFIPTSAESNEFEVVKKAPNIMISDIASFKVGSSVTIVISVDKSFNGDLVVSVGGEDYVVSVVNGSGSGNISPDLAEGTYVASIKFQGNDKFVAQEVKSNNFKVIKVSTSIKSSDVTTNFNVEKNLVAILRDSANNPIPGVKVIVTLSGGKSFTRTTDKDGKVFVSTKGLAGKVYNAKITFNGNKKYAASSKSVKVTVKKLSTTLKASKTTFKVKLAKKLSVTLRDSRGKGMGGKYVTFTCKGKTLKVKTNSHGVATATLSISKKGFTNVVVKFAGDSGYKGVSKTIRVTTIK